MDANRGPRHPYRAGRPAVVLLALAAVAAGSAAACRNEAKAPTSTQRPVLRVGTAFAPFSTRLTEEYRRTLPEVEIREQQVASSPATLRAIQDGTPDGTPAEASEEAP